MSSECTPDEEVVREFYVEGSYARGARPHEGADEFDRFIAKVKADALREAAGDIALALTEDVSTTQQDRMKFAIGYLRAKADEQ